jgi:hypothetical protein
MRVKGLKIEYTNLNKIKNKTLDLLTKFYDTQAILLREQISYKSGRKANVMQQLTSQQK